MGSPVTVKLLPLDSSAPCSLTVTAFAEPPSAFPTPCQKQTTAFVPMGFHSEWEDRRQGDEQVGECAGRALRGTTEGSRAPTSTLFFLLPATSMSCLWVLRSSVVTHTGSAPQEIKIFICTCILMCICSSRCAPQTAGPPPTYAPGPSPSQHPQRFPPSCSSSRLESACMFCPLLAPCTRATTPPTPFAGVPSWRSTTCLAPEVSEH